MEGCSWFRVIQPFGNSYGIRVHLNERHGMTDFIVGNGLVPFRGSIVIRVGFDEW